MEPTEHATAPELLRRYRREDGLTQEELALRAHLSVHAVGKHEAGLVLIDGKACAAYVTGLRMTDARREAFWAACREAVVAARRLDEEGFEAALRDVEARR